MTKNKRYPKPTEIKGERVSGFPRKRSVKAPSWGRTSVIRVLPLLIVAAAFVLGFRVTAVVQDMRSMVALVNAE